MKTHILARVARFVRTTALVLLFLLISSGCALGGLLSTAMPAATSQLPSTPSPITQVETAVPTEEPTASAPAVKGYVLYDAEKSVFNAYQPDGSLIFTVQGASAGRWLSPDTINVFEDAVYYTDERNQRAFRSTAESIEPLKIEATNIYSLAISQDQKRMAWSTLEPMGSSDLWIANRDGSEAQKVASYTAQQSQAFFLKALEWTEDGKLIFERSLTGLGGYILFGGHNSLYSYDPATGQFITYVPAEEQHGICLENYRLDLDRVVFNCGQKGPGLTIRDLESQAEEFIPLPQNFTLAGSARYSPSGKWLAYAIALGNPDNEAGQIMVVPADLSAEPKAIQSVADNNYAYVLGWLDENTLLFSRNQGPASSVWALNRAGGQPKPLETGMFAGWIH